MKLREKQSELSFPPVLSGEAVASRAVQRAGDGTHGPQQPHSLQDRGEVGRMGIAGNLD